jgi:hypothetical protein
LRKAEQKPCLVRLGPKTSSPLEWLTQGGGDASAADPEVMAICPREGADNIDDCADLVGDVVGGLAGAGGIEPRNNPLPHKDFSLPARLIDSIFDSKAPAPTPTSLYDGNRWRIVADPSSDLTLACYGLRGD